MNIKHATRCLQNGPMRRYASVSPSIIVQAPPPPPNAPAFSLDDLIISTSPGLTTLPQILEQYLKQSGSVLDTSLPYESRPSSSRRCDFEPADSQSRVKLVAHWVKDGSKSKITLSSGFALAASDKPDSDNTLIVTCAHTLEEIQHSPLLGAAFEGSLTRTSGSFIISSTPRSAAPILEPVTKVASALRRLDLLLLQCKARSSPPSIEHSLPLSPYPAQLGTIVRAHFVSHSKPNEPGWMPWIGGTWSKWVRGKILGYRDFAGRETQPGTYDALSHMLFEPPPTAGSSGGPIIDEDTGAVVGMMLGTRMDNRVEGLRGWGVPSEAIYEMFSLPGLEGRR